MHELYIRKLGLQEYSAASERMREFTTQRTLDTVDEFWYLQHPAVFTLGTNSDPQHILSQTDIPILQSDRGGQVTYHAPGQVIVYLLIDLRRKSIGVKQLVHQIEQSVVELLKDYGIDARADSDAHGVYVDEAKIASLGLRVHSGCSYHGVALNVDMDLSPFSLINPCGFPGLAITQLRDNGITETVDQVADMLMTKLSKHLEYKTSKIISNDY